MCFSVQIDKDLMKVSKRFNALVSNDSFSHFYALQQLEHELDRNQLKDILGLKRAPQSRVFKESGEDGRIYPNYFAPVMVRDNGHRIFKYMRYRVRPEGSPYEIPTKYNVFNARMDSLEKRKTWKHLFMKNHALLPFISFYEWVEGEHGKSRLINFKPDSAQLMWAPALYDSWSSKDGKIFFQSFAILTDEPPPEVEQQGHDRCPIFLLERNIDEWLNPKGKSKDDMYRLLKEKEEVYYQSVFAA